MLFNSFVFCGVFLPIILLLIHVVKAQESRRWILLGASLFFYGYWYWPYLGLLFGLVGIAWLCAIWASKTESRWPVVVASVLLLTTLSYFKYLGFFIQVASDLHVGDFSGRVSQLALPLGISFIVFQALGYVIDVHRREVPAQTSFRTVLLFKAFFPQLIAGPICRASELIPQIQKHITITAQQLWHGGTIFFVGLALKLIFADGIARQIDKLFLKTKDFDRVEAISSGLGFGTQILADFWGYSTMAVGLALMFGIRIPVNFKLPYLATSLREFWRRWHITLSQWLRDYLYKPLGGSRHGLLRTVLALMITMILGGLWHGANYTFLIWGALHALGLAIEHLFSNSNKASLGQEQISKAILIFRWAITMSIVFVAWIFFRANNVEQAVEIIRSIAFGAWPHKLSTSCIQILFWALLFMSIMVPVERLLRNLIAEKTNSHWCLIISALSLFLAVVFGADEAIPFIYFQF
jgi:alginate O-acetyltransferase complex protein AlgI